MHAAVLHGASCAGLQISGSAAESRSGLDGRLRCLREAQPILRRSTPRHAIHKNAEERKRSEDAAKLKLASKLEAAAPPKLKLNTSVGRGLSGEGNPFKWPGAERYFGGNAVTSTQVQTS